LFRVGGLSNEVVQFEGVLVEVVEVLALDADHQLADQLVARAADGAVVVGVGPISVGEEALGGGQFAREVAVGSCYRVGGLEAVGLVEGGSWQGARRPG